MKKRKSIFILGILLLVFAASVIRAAGSAPSTYNSDAKSLLEMLWAKLDEAIVSNYDAKMLVRYHDHAGTDPGDFVYRGLPINSGGIADNAVGSSEIAANAVGSSELADNAVDTGAIANGAVQATKLSTAARTRSMTHYIGDVNSSTNIGEAMFISPGNATITAMRFAVYADVVENDTNYKRVAIYKYNVSGGGFSTVATVESKVTGGVQFNGNWEAVNVTSGLSSTDLVAGQVVSVNTYNYGAGVNFSKLVVSLDYTVSE